MSRKLCHLPCSHSQEQASSSSSPPRALQQRSSKFFIILTVSFSIFTDIFLLGVIVPIIPFALQERIGIPHDKVQSWTSILLATFGAALVIVSGKVIPILPHGLFLLIISPSGYRLALRQNTSAEMALPRSSGVQTAATLMLCLASSVSVLLAARVLQGASGGLVWTVSLIIMTDKVASAELGQALGYVALARSVGVVIGPLLGGVMYERAGYYSVFALSFAFLVIDGTFRLTFVEARAASKWRPMIGAAGPSLAEKWPEHRLQDTGEMRRSRQTSPNLTASPGRGLAQRVHRRLPPTITLLGDVRLVISLWGCFLQALFLAGFDATIPIFVWRTFRWNSLAAGLIFLALVIPTCLSPVVGWLSDKHGPRWYTAAGYILSTIPLALLRLIDHDSTGQKVLLGVFLGIFGATGTLFEVPVWAEVVRCTDIRVRANRRQYSADGAVGQAYGLLNLFYAVGVTVGPLLTGFVYEAAGWGNMVLVLAVLSAISTIPTLVCTGGYIWKKQDPRD